MGSELEPLEPDSTWARVTTAEEPRSHGRGNRRHVVGLVFVAGILMVALVAVAIDLAATRGERADLVRRFEQSQAGKSKLAKEADDLRRRTRLPAVDVEMSRAVVLPPTNGVVAAISVLVAPDDFGKIWLRVDAVGAVPGATYALAGGSCESGAVPEQDWITGSATPDGDLNLVTGPLRVEPGDVNVWVRLHRGQEDFGGVRGPLAAPSRLLPNELACRAR